MVLFLRRVFLSDRVLRYPCVVAVVVVVNAIIFQAMCRLIVFLEELSIPPPPSPDWHRRGTPGIALHFKAKEMLKKPKKTSGMLFSSCIAVLERASFYFDLDGVDVMHLRLSAAHPRAEYS